MLWLSDESERSGGLKGALSVLCASRAAAELDTSNNSLVGALPAGELPFLSCSLSKLRCAHFVSEWREAASAQLREAVSTLERNDERSC